MHEPQPGGFDPLADMAGRVGIAQAVRWALACCRTRVPEPIRLAEQAVNRLKVGR